MTRPSSDEIVTVQQSGNGCPVEQCSAMLRVIDRFDDIEQRQDEVDHDYQNIARVTKKTYQLTIQTNDLVVTQLQEFGATKRAFSEVKAVVEANAETLEQVNATLVNQSKLLNAIARHLGLLKA